MMVLFWTGIHSWGRCFNADILTFIIIIAIRGRQTACCKKAKNPYIRGEFARCVEGLAGDDGLVVHVSNGCCCCRRCAGGEGGGRVEGVSASLCVDMEPSLLTFEYRAHALGQRYAKVGDSGEKDKYVPLVSRICHLRLDLDSAHEES